jgi:hypothetical protein
MHFSTPGVEKIEFEIPDAWFLEARLHHIHCDFVSYSTSKDKMFQLIPIMIIRPPSLPRLQRQGFEKDRMISILTGFANDAQIPPIEVREV